MCNPSEAFETSRNARIIGPLPNHSIGSPCKPKRKRSNDPQKPSRGVERHCFPFVDHPYGCGQANIHKEKSLVISSSPSNLQCTQSNEFFENRHAVSFINRDRLHIDPDRGSSVSKSRRQRVKPEKYDLLIFQASMQLVCHMLWCIRSPTRE